MKFTFDEESLRELAEQLRPYLKDKENAAGYLPSMNMKELARFWKKDLNLARGMVKAFILKGIPIGKKEGKTWVIDTEVALECMKPIKMQWAMQMVKEGKVPKGELTA